MYISIRHIVVGMKVLQSDALFQISHARPVRIGYRYGPTVGSSEWFPKALYKAVSFLFECCHFLPRKWFFTKLLALLLIFNRGIMSLDGAV